MLTSKKQLYHRYLYNKRGVLLVIVMGWLLLSGLVATLAFADSPVVTGTVNAGSFSQGASTPGSFSGAVGATGTISNLTMAVSDLTGSGAGWHITVTSTTVAYSSGVGASTPTPAPWPASASQMTSITANCNVAGSCSNASLSSSTPIAIPAAATPPAAVSLFSAAVSTGEGAYTITPTIVVTIPGYARAGATYTSTYTVTAVSGP
jgi:hypothetical protein